MKIIGVLFATMSAVQSWTVPPNSFTRSHTATLSSNVLRMADDGESDMEYSVSLGLPPLGIVFEDIGSGFPPKGVEVIALTSGGQGEQCGKIEIGDRLKVRPSNLCRGNLICTKSLLNILLSGGIMTWIQTLT